jgi:uncharacterized protein YggU (UPF0235/DUF167 family)
MARPKADFPPAEAILALADGDGRLTLRVTPGARAESVSIEPGRLVVKVRAVPEGGKANEAVLNLLACALGIGTSRLRLVRGTTGRDKQVRIEGG